MAADNHQPVAVIMAGGSGTRFWPASTRAKPKQYLALWGNQSLIQKTVQRIESLVPESRLYICSTQSQRHWLETQLPQLGHPNWMILEPEGRNTAPCLMLSALHLQRAGYSDETPMLVLPADHHIGNEFAFRSLLTQAFSIAVRSKGLVTFGISPTSPHTGYGYIEAGEPTSTHAALSIRRFVEKPDLKTAEGYLQSGKFFWNSGIFVWTIGAIIEAFQAFMPTQWKLLSEARGNLSEVYAKMPSVAVDVAIMEKAKNGFVLPAPNLGWSDVGSWDALYKLCLEHNHQTGGNFTLSGNVTTLQSNGCLVKTGPELNVALVGVDNLVVVEEDGRLLILNRSQDQLVKKLAERE